MDFSRLRQGELIAGIAGIALIVFLFLDWFEGLSGWQAWGLDLTGFIVVAAAVSAVKFAGLAAMGQRLNIPVRRGGITLALAATATLIIVWTLFAAEFDGIKIGVILGLAATIAIAVGALLALREDGWEMLVADGRTAPARASGATATRPLASKPAAKKKAPARKSTAKKSAAKKRAAGSR